MTDDDIQRIAAAVWQLVLARPDLPGAPAAPAHIWLTDARTDVADLPARVWAHGVPGRFDLPGGPAQTFLVDTRIDAGKAATQTAPGTE